MPNWTRLSNFAYAEILLEALNACKRTQVDPRASNTVQIFDRSDSCSGTLLSVLEYPALPAPPAVVLADVQTAIARHKTTWATYNADTAGVAACKSAGASAGWTATMQDYYCTFPGVSPEIRSCFTFSVRGTAPYTLRSYPDAYNYCAIQHTRTPMKWVMDNEDAVFKAVMIDKKF